MEETESDLLILVRALLLARGFVESTSAAVAGFVLTDLVDEDQVLVWPHLTAEVYAVTMAEIDDAVSDQVISDSISTACLYERVLRSALQTRLRIYVGKPPLVVVHPQRTSHYQEIMHA